VRARVIPLELLRDGKQRARDAEAAKDAGWALKKKCRRAGAAGVKWLEGFQDAETLGDDE
jgi:hypothetical protein